MKKKTAFVVLALAAVLMAVGVVIPVVAQTFTSVAVGFGSAGSPSMTFLNDPDTGIYRPAANVLGISVNGIEVGRFNSTGQVGAQRSTAIVTSATTMTLTATDCGKSIFSMLGSGTQVYTLPAAVDVPGCTLHFVTGHASGEVLINAAADAQGFDITTMSSAKGTADSDIVRLTDTTGAAGLKNTAATNQITDDCYLVSDGVLTWFSRGLCSGIWAAQ